MPSFQVKIGRKRLRKRKNKKHRSVSFLPDAKQKIPTKQKKKFKKLKNTILASFQAIIGWKRLRKRENKNERPISFLLTTKQKIPKKQKKIQKIKKYRYGVI